MAFGPPSIGCARRKLTLLRPMVRTCRDILEDPLNNDIFWGIIANSDTVHDISIIHAMSWTLNAF